MRGSCGLWTGGVEKGRAAWAQRLDPCGAVVVRVTGGWVVTRQGEFCIPRVSRRAERVASCIRAKCSFASARGRTKWNFVLPVMTEPNSVPPGRRPTGEPSFRFGDFLFPSLDLRTPRPPGRRPELEEVSGMDESKSILLIGTEKSEGKSVGEIFLAASRRAAGPVAFQFPISNFQLPIANHHEVKAESREQKAESRKQKRLVRGVGGRTGFASWRSRRGRCLDRG